MINCINVNRDHLVPQSQNKTIEEIEIHDLKMSLKDIAMAESITFICDITNKSKFLKHRSLRVGNK